MQFQDRTQQPSTSQLRSMPSSRKDTVEKEEDEDDEEEDDDDEDEDDKEEEDDDDPIDLLSSQSKLLSRKNFKPYYSSKHSSVSLLNPIEEYPLTEVESVNRSSPESDFLLNRFNQLTLSKSRLTKSKRYPRKWPTSLSTAQQLLLQEELQFNSGDTNQSQKKYEIPGASCEIKELQILTSSNQWLNDKIINFYGALINNKNSNILNSEQMGYPPDPDKISLKVYCFSTYFMTKFDRDGYQGVARWTKKVDLFEKDLILIPLNLSNLHWTLGAINNQKKRFEYYDSLGSPNLDVYSKMRRYYKNELLAKEHLDIDLNEWSDYKPENVPLQTNSYDCGVFVCQFMYSLSYNLTGKIYHNGHDYSHYDCHEDDVDNELFDFSVENMGYFRSKMAFEIITRTFIPDELYLS